MNQWAEHWFDNYHFILYELYLHLLAALIKKKKYAAAARFIEASYHYLEGPGNTKYLQDGPAAFNEPMRAVDEGGGRQAGGLAPIGEMFLNRAAHPKIAFHDLFQVDLLLWLRPNFLEPGACTHWYPRCIGYARSVDTLELFARATSKNGFAPLRELLKVSDARQFLTRLQAHLSDPGTGQLTHRLFFFRSRMEELLNLKGLMHAAGMKG